MIKNILAAVGLFTLARHALILIDKIIDYRVTEILHEERVRTPPKES